MRSSLQAGILNLYKYLNLSFSVTTVYPVAELGMNPVVSEEDPTQAPMEVNTHTRSFFPTVAVIENSLEAFTVRPETHTFVPFIPNVLPEATPAVTHETPLMAGAEEESTEAAADQPGNIIALDTTRETITGHEEEAEPEVEEMPPTEPDDRGEVETEEQATDGKTSSDSWSPRTQGFIDRATLDCGVDTFCATDRKQEEPQKTRPRWKSVGSVAVWS